MLLDTSVSTVLPELIFLTLWGCCRGFMVYLMCLLCIEHRVPWDIVDLEVLRKVMVDYIWGSVSILALLNYE